MRAKPSVAASLLAKYQRQIDDYGENVQVGTKVGTKVGSEYVNKNNNISDFPTFPTSNIVTLTRARERTHVRDDVKNSSTRYPLNVASELVGKVGKSETPLKTLVESVPTFLPTSIPTSNPSDTAKLPVWCIRGSDEFEERAAILEYDAGMDRQSAEQAAAEQLTISGKGETK